jgi:hypothetical protein
VPTMRIWMPYILTEMNQKLNLLVLGVALALSMCKAPEFNNDCDLTDNLKERTFTNFLSNSQGSSYNPNIAKLLFPDLVKLCSQNSSTSNSSLVLSEFQFLGAENDLNTDYKGIFDGTNITVNIPYGRVARMIPNLKFTGSSATIAGATYVPGGNIINFSSSVSIIIRSDAGQSQTYNVSIFQLRPISDTNQSQCYTGSTLTSCAIAMATDPRQDAMLDEVPYLRGLQGSSTLGSYTTDPVNLDKLNGIVWKTCEEGQSNNDCSIGSQTQVTYAQAVTLCDNLNSTNSNAGYAGLKKWRLPTWQELSQLQDHNTASILWNTTQFPSVSNVTGVNRYRWTSSIILPAGTSTISLNELHNGQNMGGSNPVRCVSGDTPPSFEYTDNGDGTVLDRRTKLIIQKCSNGQTYSAGTCVGGLGTISWSAALTYCNSLTLAGRSWRLPNLNELVSLMDMSKTAPFFDTTIFPNQTTANFHSSTTLMSNTAYNYLLTIGSPAVGGISGKGVPENAKCVSGP